MKAKHRPVATRLLGHSFAARVAQDTMRHSCLRRLADPGNTTLCGFLFLTPLGLGRSGAVARQHPSLPDLDGEKQPKALLIASGHSKHRERAKTPAQDRKTEEFRAKDTCHLWRKWTRARTVCLLEAHTIRVALRMNAAIPLRQVAVPCRFWPHGALHCRQTILGTP